MLGFDYYSYLIPLFFGIYVGVDYFICSSIHQSKCTAAHDLAAPTSIVVLGNNIAFSIVATSIPVCSGSSAQTDDSQYYTQCATWVWDGEPGR